ncbi:MAG: ImmA/IrrE family metallo-endopeptidase [Ilumatobacteraceae bacterium]
MNDAFRIAEPLVAAMPTVVKVALLQDPVATIKKYYGVTTQMVAAESVADGCGIEGRYFPHLNLIRINDALTERRFMFTVLHELGHHVAQHDPASIAAIASKQKFEEQVAHAFAAELLISRAQANSIFGDSGPTASTVAELYAASSASRWACCVRAAQRLNGNGYVLVAVDGVIEFAAIVGTAFPIGRNAVQDDDHLINEAAKYGTARNSGIRLRQPSGVRTREFAGDAVVTDGNYIFAVLTDEKPTPWGGWVGVLDQYPEAIELDCEQCDRTTRAWKLCPTCREPICSNGDCGWCACKRKPAIRERVCTACYQTRPIGQFEGDGTICNDHR